MSELALPEWLGTWVEHSLPLATLLVCLLSGIFPLINAEIYLLAIAPLIHTQSMLITVGIMAGIGQVLAKALLYLVAYRALDVPFLRKKVSPEAFQEWHEKIKKMGWKLPVFIFSSAFFGFPPFLVLSFVLGALRSNFWTFVLTGLAGRILRFTLIVGAPQWVMGVFHPFRNGS